MHLQRSAAFPAETASGSSAAGPHRPEQQSNGDHDIGHDDDDDDYGVPFTYRPQDGRNRAYKATLAQADSNVSPTDCGYTSDVCDYNVSSEKNKGSSSSSKATVVVAVPDGAKSDDGLLPGNVAGGRVHHQVQSDDSYYVHHEQRRSTPTVSRGPKPISPSIKVSLHDRRQKLIQQRADVFRRCGQAAAAAAADDDHDQGLKVDGDGVDEESNKTAPDRHRDATAKDTPNITTTTNTSGCSHVVAFNRDHDDDVDGRHPTNRCWKPPSSSPLHSSQPAESTKVAFASTNQTLVDTTRTQACFLIFT